MTELALKHGLSFFHLYDRDGLVRLDRAFVAHLAASNTALHHLPLKAALEYAAWATLAPDGQARHRRGLLFRVPHRLDMHHLVPVETIERNGVTMLRRAEAEWRARDGFALTDAGTDLAGAQ